MVEITSSRMPVGKLTSRILSYSFSYRGSEFKKDFAIKRGGVVPKFCDLQTDLLSGFETYDPTLGGDCASLCLIATLRSVVLRDYLIA